MFKFYDIHRTLHDTQVPQNKRRVQIQHYQTKDLQTNTLKGDPSNLLIYISHTITR